MTTEWIFLKSVKRKKKQKKKLLNMTMTMIPIAIETLGTIPKDLVKKLEK